MLIAYVHGFLSGPNAVKSTILKNYLKEHEPELCFDAPDFPDTPKEAYEYLEAYFKKAQKSHDKICLVGSSMGGFFSTLMADKFGFKAALLNPCAHPQDYFKDLVGSQYNAATDVYFELHNDMLAYICYLDSRCKVNSDRLFVLLQRGDEVLDYTKAQSFYAGCKMDIEDGGCHTFDNFESKIPSILEFFKA